VVLPLALKPRWVSTLSKVTARRSPGAIGRSNV
jgi:hypothetical protein